MSVLVSPVVLFFILGAAAAFARSNLALPEAVAKALALYLMAAIGLKGGAAVATAGFSPDMAVAAIAGIALSVLIPLPCYAVLRRFGRLDTLNAAAIAAHYGSVSVVTFVTGIEILQASGLSPAGHMVAVLALMETPALLVGLYLAKRTSANAAGSRNEVLHETFLNGPVVLLLGSFAIGSIVGAEGLAAVSPVFVTGFQGILCLFLLDMGLIAARRLMAAHALSWRLVVLAIALPLVNGTIGVIVGTAIGMDTATAAALGILAASASYIAAPAVMRMALPEADSGLSLALSLGVTFPFNVVAGIPIYIMLASAIAPGG